MIVSCPNCHEMSRTTRMIVKAATDSNIILQCPHCDDIRRIRLSGALGTVYIK
jgi:hypothetical protein